MVFIEFLLPVYLKLPATMEAPCLGRQKQLNLTWAKTIAVVVCVVTHTLKVIQSINVSCCYHYQSLVVLFTGNDYAIYGITRLAPALNPDASFVNDPPPHNVGPYSPAASFHSGLNRSNTMNEYPVNAESSGVASPYLPMASLNFPIANGIHRTHSARVPPGLPVKLPLPLPMSMQQSHHGIRGSNLTSLNPSKGPSPITAATTAHLSGPSFDKVRSLETEGHLV